MARARSQSDAWSWRHAVLKSRLPPTTRHVLLTLSCYMNDLGRGCYPTTRELQDATGLSERAVVEHIGRAKDAGWLKVSKHGFGGQKWKNNQYEARWPDAEGTDPASVPSAEKALTVVPKGTDPDDKKALTEGQSNSPVTYPRISPDAREAARAEREDFADDLFENAFRQWPVSFTESMEAARSAWNGLSSSERSAAAEEAGRYVETTKAVGRKLLCAFETYLRDKRWEGLPARPVKSKAETGPKLASPFDAVWMAWRTAQLAATGPGSKGSGWPLVDALDERGRRGMAAEFGERWHATPLIEAMERVRVGSALCEAWRAEHERRGWPWPATIADRDHVAFPSGGPEALDRFISLVASLSGRKDRAA